MVALQPHIVADCSQYLEADEFLVHMDFSGKLKKAQEGICTILNCVQAEKALSKSILKVHRFRIYSPEIVQVYMDRQ